MSLNPKIDRIRSPRVSRAVKLRPATPDDLELLQSWDRQTHVIAAKGHDDWQWEKELARHPDWREQLIAEVDGRPIGFVEISDPSREDCQYWGGCIAEDHRAIDIWIGDQALLCGPDGAGRPGQCPRLLMKAPIASTRAWDSNMSCTGASATTAASFIA